MDKDKNRELLSRRDFFKKAAIKTLPFIAVITLPPILTACPSEPIPTPSGCDDCSSACKDSCKENSTNSGNNSSQEGSGNNNKYTAVDLGLSVLWAEHNLGCTKAAEYAPRYYWGKKGNEGYNDWEEWLNEGKKNIISTDRDIVKTTWEGDWRLPSYAEARELADLCKCSAETRDGVRGLKVVGPNGNSIFIAIEKGNNATLGLYMTGTRESKGSINILIVDAENRKLDYDITSSTSYIFVRPVKNGGSGCKDCSSGCISGCYTSCINSAKSSNQSGGSSSGGNNSSGCATCENTCNSGCGGQCYYSCGGTCSNNCQGGCRFSCIGWSMSVKNCASGTCYGSCNNNCDNTCKSFCYTSCQNVGKQS